MKLLFSSLLTVLLMATASSQSKLPYYEIPEASVEFTAGTVVSRMVDGLGFRYYWATEGLIEKDLDFKPNNDARTTIETINHILDLSQVTLNAVLNKPNGEKQPEMTFTEKRKKTLENLKKASDILKLSKDLSQYKIIFGEKEFPFWNAINGPIADATWHVGQIVSFRRSSGNPLPKGVSFLTGTVKRK
ncbi:DinB family protein [Tenacibaculum ovolyticum]|uniref:DinB family protein n=1 Tax=Tenacibaculum ovolyticum TaxID=104270 RepID=UPI003BA88276